LTDGLSVCVSPVVLLCCCAVVLLCCCAVVLLCCCAVVLLCCCAVVLLCYRVLGGSVRANKRQLVQRAVVSAKS
jgi:hypothetical protein